MNQYAAPFTENRVAAQPPDSQNRNARFNPQRVGQSGDDNEGPLGSIMSLKAAIVGVSGYGRIHYSFMRELALAGKVDLVGATIINPGEEAGIVTELTGMGCRIFGDYQTMLAALEGQVDICCLPLPIHLHAPMTCQALEAGWNVLVEKPLSATIQDVRSIQRIEQATGRFAAVGFQEVYSPHAQALKQRLLAGEFGRVRSMKGRGLWPRSFDYYGRNNWAGRLKVGDHWVLDSPLNNALSHYLHLLLFLAGASPRETARPLSLQGELYRAQAIESFDTGGVRIETDSGVPILFLGTHSSRKVINPEIVIEADEGRIEWSVHGECRFYRGDSDEPFEVSPPRGDQRKAMAESVLARVTDPEAFICTTESASCHTLIVNGLHESVPICTFPSELTETIEDAEGLRTVVNSLDDALEAAFKSNRLLSETDLPWGRAGERIDLTRLASFPGPG